MDKHEVELKAENIMLLNTLQKAQRLVAQGRLDEANAVLTGAINKVLKLDGASHG